MFVPPFRQPVTEEIRAELVKIVGELHVIDGQRAEPYCHEPTGRFTYRHPYRVTVISPASTRGVSQVLALLHKHGIPFVPRTGGTGLVGASVPRDKAVVVLNLSRLKKVEDCGDGTIFFGAGVPLWKIHEQVRRLYPNHIYGGNFGSPEACVGGIFATNAGGEWALLYGTARDQVAEIEYVMADGYIHRILGPNKQNVGYRQDLGLIGTEGTLAVITGARVRLWPKPAERKVMVLALPGVYKALDIATELMSKAFAGDVQLRCLEYVDKASLVQADPKIAQVFPFDLEGPHGAFMFLELVGTDVMDVAENLFEELVKRKVINEEDAEIGLDDDRCDWLWEFRHNVPASLNPLEPAKFDVSLPLKNYAKFCALLKSTFATKWPHVQVFLFGHMGDGTVHVNLLGVTDAELDEVTKAVLEMARDLGGVISGEHCVGAKLRDHLGYTRSEREVVTMWNTRLAWGAENMNPGVLFPDEFVA